MKKYICYHWSRNDDCLGYGDGRKIVLGETLSVGTTPSLCNAGLHGSESIIDALGYAAGSHLWKVEIWGKVDKSDDKLCGKYRKAIAQYGDLLLLIVEFSYWCKDQAQKHAAAHTAADAAAAARVAAARAAYAAADAAAARDAAAAYAAAYNEERKLQEQWWLEKLSHL